MRKSIPAYLFLLGLSISSCSEKTLESPDYRSARQQANSEELGDGGQDGVERAFDFPYAPEQYVSKAVQIETPADSSDRPERPRYEANSTEQQVIDAEEPEAGYTSLNYAYRTSFENTFAADAARAASYTFVSSENIGKTGYTSKFINTPAGNGYPDYIYDVQIAKSSSAGTDAKSGFFKLGLDLNRGAGGKFIYLTFSRTRAEYGEYGQDTYPAYMRSVITKGAYNYTFSDALRPLTTITARGYRNSTIFTGPPSGFTDVYQFVSQFTGPYALKYYKVDLNDGSGGKYIRPYKSRTEGNTAYMKEIGVVAGNSSNIWPPSGWIRDNNDLNDGAGGDYIYFCYKR